jgi:ankyrin repeat protein
MFKAVFLAVSGFCVMAVSACKSTPKAEPVPDENVWSLLAKGDNRARDFFLGKVDVYAADSQGKTPLHYAAELQDPQLAAFFISLGAPLDAADSTRQTPLGISAEKVDPKVARVLVAAGANIHKPAKDGLSPAKTSIKKMDSAFLGALLTPATVQSVDNEGKTILHLASEAGKARAVDTIITTIDAADNAGTAVPGNRNSPLDKKDAEGNNPLDIALSRPDSRNHMEAAEQLILAGSVSENPIYQYFAPAVRSANYNVRRSDGFAPLHFAAGEGYEGLIAFLIEKKANVNLKNSSGATPLHEAARSGNLRAIEVILKNGAEINAQDAKGNSALHIGIPPKDHQKAINLFLSHGANPNLRDEHGESPLHILVTLNRNPETVQALLGGGADVSVRNIDGKTSLYLAIQENRLKLIPLLLSYNSDIFAADNSGITPFDRAMMVKGPVLNALITSETVQQQDNAGNTILHAAVKNKGDPGIISLILNQKAFVNARNKEGETPLHIAVRLNQRETGEFLISRGADIFSSNSVGESPLYLALVYPQGPLPWLFNSQTIMARDGLGNSMLHYVAQWKLDQHIPFIIQKGVSTEAANATGETPLFMAVKYNGPSTAKTLLSMQANLHARDSLGNSTLHAAVRWNAKNAALTLIDSGIDINAHSLNGTSPLHDSVRLGITDIAGLLIDRGADLEVRDAEGNTPFMEAVRAGYTEAMELLASRGADPMTRNARGDTPLHLAVSIEDADMIKALLRMGVSIHARNTRNRTPFQIALGQSSELVSILLTRDRINGPDDFGNSALHIALQEKAPAAIVKIIIDRGVRQNAVDSNGRTPLRLAAEMGAWDSARTLADSGSDPFSSAVDGKTPAEIALARGGEGIRALFSGKAVNAKDASGNTILHYAARMGKPDAISLLLELGANKAIKNIAAESPADIAMRWNHRENAALLN